MTLWESAISRVLMTADAHDSESKPGVLFERGGEFAVL